MGDDDEDVEERGEEGRCGGGVGGGPMKKGKGVLL